MTSMRYIALGLLLSLCLASAAEDADKYEKWGPTSQGGGGVIVRLGYTIGGTTPIPLPSEIRSINAFQPHGGATIGADVYKMLSRRWGFSVGWHFVYEGFHTSADVKNYKMSLTQEGNTMSGYFTGCDITNVELWGLTMPVLATVRVSPRWNISAGPFFTVFVSESFKGQVYDNKEGVGYLRVDSPVGEKVNIDRSSPATYDFSDNLRNWTAGLEFAFDWKATRHMNVFALLDWSLSDIFEPDFPTVEFKLYPIYATVGLAYRY